MSHTEQIHDQEIMDGMSVRTAVQPTKWLDITECDDGLCVAWNSERYLLTNAQARKLRDTLSALMAGVVKD